MDMEWLFNSFKRYKWGWIYVVVSFLIISSPVYGQSLSDDTPPFRERLFFGGNMGLQFGTMTDIQIAPVVGFWVLPRVAVAIGPDYHYFKYQNLKTNIYGAKGYVELVVFQNINKFVPLGANTGIFIHLEDELLSLESAFWKEQNTYTTSRFYVNSLLVGPGLSQQIGRRSSLNLMVLWVLNDSGYGIYSNPDIRVSFTF